MTLVDAGFLVAMVDRRNGLHDRAVRWLRLLGDERLVVTDYVLTEAYAFFAHPAARRPADLLISALVNRRACELIVADRTLLETGIALFRDRRDKHWSLVDCVSFALMHRRGLTKALAYDQHFEQAGFDALLRRDPS